jgi:hypothetical protein
MLENTVSLRAERRKLRPIARFTIAAVAALLVISAAVAVGVVFWLNSAGGDSATVITSVQVTYPQGWSERPLSEDDRKAGLLLAIEKGSATFLARTVVGRLAEGFSLDQLAADTEVALGSQIEGFDLISNEVTTIEGFGAIRLYYRQEAGPRDDAFQTMMVIVPTETQTFYLTLRAEKTEFTAAQRDASQVIGNFLAQVKRSQ